VNADFKYDPGDGVNFLCLLEFVWALQTNGPIGFLLHLFAPKGDTTGFLKVLMVFCVSIS
jgi:hypothetical protein